MSKKILRDLIDRTLLKQYINDNEEVSAQEYIMNKKDKILKKHTSSVYPIKQMEKGGRQVFYTKLDPGNRKHSHLIYSANVEDLEDKIIAYYIGIELSAKTTVEDIMELAASELKPETAERHRQLFKKHFSNIAHIKVSYLSETDIRGVLQNMIDKGIKPKAFNNATSTLNKINDYCAYNHIDCINIRDKISEFRKYKLVGKQVFLSESKVDTELAFNEDEAVKIIRYSLENPDYHNLAISVLLTTGLRSGELLALIPEDVDLANRRITADKMEKTKSYRIINRCKDDSDRIVFLNEDAFTVLNVLMDMRGKEETDCPYLFLNSFSDDGKMHLRAMDNRIRKIQHQLNLTGTNGIRSCHDCRRTYASIQYLHGVDIKTIQAQLGHSTPQQTWDYIKDVIDTETRLQTLSKGCILG